MNWSPKQSNSKIWKISPRDTEPGSPHWFVYSLVQSGNDEN